MWVNTESVCVGGRGKQSLRCMTRGSFEFLMRFRFFHARTNLFFFFYFLSFIFFCIYCSGNCNFVYLSIALSCYCYSFPSSSSCCCCYSCYCCCCSAALERIYFWLRFNCCACHCCCCSLGISQNNFCTATTTTKWPEVSAIDSILATTMCKGGDLTVSWGQQ